jgi:hypothetical protein
VTHLDDWSAIMAQNFRLALFSAVAFFGAALMPAAAQVNLNMNQITCGDLLGYDRENQNFVKYWMSGYYNASRGNDVLDLQRLEANSKRVLDYCKRHKSTSLTKAINVNAR